MSAAVTNAVEWAVEAFRAGEPIIVYDDDGREDEADMMYPAAAVDPEDVATLRLDAGGLVCVALADEIAERFDLPFYHDAIDHPATEHGDMGYDSRPSFSMSVNHRFTFTGITDQDRARTIRALAEVSENPHLVNFPREFRSPGHVFLLRAATDLLAQRQGHTELAIALAEEAGIQPAVALCEMLDEHSGDSRSKTDAAKYANRHGMPMLAGDEIISALGG